MLEQIGSFYDDPRRFLPDCALLDILFQFVGGGGGDGQGDPGGTSNQPGEKPEGKADEASSPTAEGSGISGEKKGEGKSGGKKGDGDGKTPGGKTKGVVTDGSAVHETKAAPIEDVPEADNDYTSEVVAVYPVNVNKGRWTMDIIFTVNGKKYRCAGIPIKRVSANESEDPVIFKPEGNYLITETTDSWITPDYEYRIPKGALDEALKAQKKGK
jgi:hypothetical protein